MKISFKFLYLLSGLVCVVTAACQMNTVNDDNLPATTTLINNFQSVSKKDLLNTPDNDWLSFRGNLSSWGYSAADQINKTNVANLQLAWSLPMEPGGNEVSPLVRNGVIFLVHPNDKLQAIDAVTGTIFWEYDRNFQFTKSDWVSYSSNVNRNVALYGNTLFMATADGYIAAINALNGLLQWEAKVGEGFAHTSGPIIANGHVISGRSCSFSLAGGCYITAHDAKSGKEIWRFYVIARPGTDADASWGDVPLESRFQVGAWFPGSYDADENLIYWGTSVPSPSPEILRGTEGLDVLYSNSTVALDADSGELVWYFQHLPRDNWDLDHAFERILIDTTLDLKQGAVWEQSPVLKPNTKRKTLTGVPGKTGLLWTLDRLTGEFLWVRETVPQNVIEAVEPDSGKVVINESLVPREEKVFTDKICPSAAGAKNWPAGSIDPENQAFFVPLQNLCMRIAITTMSPGTEDGYAFDYRIEHHSTNTSANVGILDAYSLETGERLWRYESGKPAMLSTLTTAGGLVFAGDSAGNFRAFDTADGRVLWETILSGPVSGYPVSFSVNSDQYIAVAAGGGDKLTGTLNAINGIVFQRPFNKLFVFKLP